MATRRTVCAWGGVYEKFACEEHEPHLLRVARVDHPFSIAEGMKVEVREDGWPATS